MYVCVCVYVIVSHRERSPHPHDDLEYSQLHRRASWWLQQPPAKWVIR